MVYCVVYCIWKKRNSVNYFRLWLIIYKKHVIFEILNLVTICYKYWRVLTLLSLHLYKSVQGNETEHMVFTWIDTSITTTEDNKMDDCRRLHRRRLSYRSFSLLVSISIGRTVLSSVERSKQQPSSDLERICMPIRTDLSRMRWRKFRWHHAKQNLKYVWALDCNAISKSMCKPKNSTILLNKALIQTLCLHKRQGFCLNVKNSIFCLCVFLFLFF